MVDIVNDVVVAAVFVLIVVDVLRSREIIR